MYDSNSPAETLPPGLPPTYHQVPPPTDSTFVVELSLARRINTGFIIFVDQAEDFRRQISAWRERVERRVVAKVWEEESARLGDELTDKEKRALKWEKVSLLPAAPLLVQ